MYNDLMIKAVIFDMDGTMVDTEVLWREINGKLAQRYGHEYDESIKPKMMGRKDLDALTVFKEHFKIDATVEELIQIRRKMLLDNLHVVKIKPGLYELLDLLDSLSIKKAIATAAFKEFAERIIIDFNLQGRFDVVVTANDVKESKPDPSVFLESARRLGVRADECLVLEDSWNGVEAAYNANMRVFAIPHNHSANHDFSKATKVIKSMLDITPETLAH